ncbi:MAG: hypothetical protein ACT4OF_06730 [Caulobacteraceae bacterium]
MSESGIQIGIDRRVVRTRMLLAEALMSLGAERGVEAIEVGDLVEERLRKETARRWPGRQIASDSRVR